MPFFRMDKWYGDFLTGDGHYLFFYCTVLRLAGGVQTLLSVCSSRPDAYRSVTRATEHLSLRSDADRSVLAARHGGIRFARDAGRAFFRFPDTEVSLRFDDAVYAGRDPMRVHAWGGSLLWFPCAVHARVTGTVTLPGERFEVSGAPGYADFVHSHILPPLAPVRTVLWGRFQESGTSLTFSVMERPRGGLEGRVFLVENGTIETLSPVRIDRHEGARASRLGLSLPEAYTLHTRSARGILRITVTHGRAAVEAEFVDPDAVPRPSVRAAYRWFSRNPRGVKFLSTASLSREAPGSEAPAVTLQGVSEYVVFGGRG